MCSSDLNDEYMSLEEINENYKSDFGGEEYDGEFYDEILDYYDDMTDKEKDSLFVFGYFEEDGPKGGGIVLPFQESDYCQSLHDNLAYYYNNPDDYYKKCCEIQEYAREAYDWSTHIHKWVEFLS